VFFFSFQNILSEKGVKKEMHIGRENNKGGKRKSIYAFVMIASICQSPSPRSLSLNCVHLITHYIKSRRCISFFSFIVLLCFSILISILYILLLSALHIICYFFRVLLFVLCFYTTAYRLDDSSMTKSMIWSINWRANRVF